MKNYVNIAKFFVVFLVIVILFSTLFFNYMLSSPNKDSKDVILKVDKGSTYTTISTKLKELNLIRSSNFFKFYVKLAEPKKLEAGEYVIKANMSIKEIVKLLEKGSNFNADTIRITFTPNINMDKLADLLEDKTNIDDDIVFSKLSNMNYLDSLIKKYDFLTEEIKNKNIYYSLEGYLEPDTYEFRNKDISVEEVFTKLLDERKKTLKELEPDFKNTNYSLHQVLTLASIVQAESGQLENMPKIAAVFLNRLKRGDNLGSDVTTYYGIKEDMSERDLKIEELNRCNAYNTRNGCLKGKLPVGPIGNPTKEAIKAVLNPDKNDYLYFVSDKYGKIYFTKTLNEHNAIIKSLKEQGKWYEYR